MDATTRSMTLAPIFGTTCPAALAVGVELLRDRPDA